MNRKIQLVFVLGLALSLALAACGPAAPEPAPVVEAPAEEAPAEEAPAAGPALAVTGLVGQELALTVADLEGMGVVTLTAEHPKNGPTEYSGVPLSAVLEMAGIGEGAGALAVTASDGYSAEVPLADAQACADCLIAIEDGALNMVMPGMSSKAWVKDVTTLELVAGEMAEAPALKVTGAVAGEQAWSEEQVKALDTLDVESTNKDGETSTYTGVLITDLLALAAPNADATTVVFVADDGYTAEISLEELNACTDCIVSFRNQGGFSTVLPGFPGNLQVKGVVEIQVK